MKNGQQKYTCTRTRLRRHQRSRLVITQSARLDLDARYLDSGTKLFNKFIWPPTAYTQIDHLLAHGFFESKRRGYRTIRRKVITNIQGLPDDRTP